MSEEIVMISGNATAVCAMVFLIAGLTYGYMSKDDGGASSLFIGVVAFLVIFYNIGVMQ